MCPRMADRDPVGALVRAHISAFNDWDLARLLTSLDDQAVWTTGSDRLVGRDQLQPFFAAAFAELTPQLEIVNLIEGERDAACELRETYRVDGVEHTASIAAFLSFQDGRIGRAKIYQEGSVDPA
jgi:hypothetical protein